MTAIKLASVFSS